MSNRNKNTSWDGKGIGAAWGELYWAVAAILWIYDRWTTPGKSVLSNVYTSKEGQAFVADSPLF